MKIADMHCDTMSYLYYSAKPALRDSDGHVSAQLLKKGGYCLQNFAVFIEHSKKPYHKACNEMIDRFELELLKNADLLAPVHTYADIERNEKDGKISAVLTIEDSAVLEGDLSRLKRLYDRGVRMMSVTWNYRNELGSPAFNAGEGGDTINEGLTGTGVEAIREMERLGIVPDVSHLSDAGFWDVYRHTNRPFAASHSNARALCGHPRNLSDDMLRTLADRGGVVGVNFHAPFLGVNRTTLSAIIMHMKHMINTAGINSVSLGSDFDGIPDAGEVMNAGNMQLLINAMEEAGLHESEIEKIAYKNLFAFYRETLVKNHN